MSNEEQKYKHSTRMARGEAASRRQLQIARQNGLIKDKSNDEAHRYNKHHAMDCGNSECGLCGNPRKIHKEKTVQEKSFEQTKLHNEE